MKVKNAKLLNNSTKIFDACGVKGMSNYQRPSKKWDNALEFLEWFGLPLMEGFEFIIIDNMDEQWQDQYI